MTKYSDAICLQDMRMTDMQGMNDAMVRLGKSITEAIGNEDVVVQWINVLNMDVDSRFYNPDGNIGRFMVINRSKP